MNKLNSGHIYGRDLFTVETGDKIGDGWPMAGLSTGCSGEDSKDYTVEITGCHGDEIPSRVVDAKDTAGLIAQLLNFYFRGYLFVGNPNQLELFNDHS